MKATHFTMAIVAGLLVSPAMQAEIRHIQYADELQQYSVTWDPAKSADGAARYSGELALS